MLRRGTCEAADVQREQRALHPPIVEDEGAGFQRIEHAFGGSVSVTVTLQEQRPIRRDVAGGAPKLHGCR